MSFIEKNCFMNFIFILCQKKSRHITISPVTLKFQVNMYSWCTQSFMFVLCEITANRWLLIPHCFENLTTNLWFLLLYSVPRNAQQVGCLRIFSFIHNVAVCIAFHFADDYDSRLLNVKYFKWICHMSRDSPLQKWLPSFTKLSTSLCF